MVEKYAQSIDEKAQIAFRKVKEDVLFLNSKIEQIEKTLIKHSKNSNIHVDKNLLNIIESLTRRIEILESQKVINEVKVTKKSKKIIDDLTKIEGIGPVISKVMNKNEIFTFQDLSKTTIKKLKEILAKNDLSYHDPTTWAKQAKLAHNNEWEKLQIWQDELKGGKL